MAIEEVLDDRGKSYGSFQSVASVAQRIKVIFRDYPGWRNLTLDKKESLDLMATKMARVIVGDSDHKDSWDDIAGYAMLISKQIEEIQNASKEGSDT